MKPKREHRVPLSQAACDVLARLDDFRQPRGPLPAEGFIFPGQRSGRPLSDMALTAVLRRMGQGELTAHGFRSTFRDWGSEATHYPGDMLELALAHALPSKTEAAYRRGDMLEKRRQLMSDWADYLAGSGAGRPCSRPPAGLLPSLAPGTVEAAPAEHRGTRP
jgi:integrase